MSKIKTKFNDSVIDEGIDNIRLYNRYKLLACNMFKWNNLPMGIKSDYIEKVLYEYGQGVLFKDKVNGFLFLPCSSIGNVNVIGEDVYVLATGFNGYTKNIRLIDSIEGYIKFKGLEGIRCKNNDLMQPSKLDVIDYCNKMNNVEKAIDRNLAQQKYPYMIFTNEQNEFSMKTMLKQVDEGRPVIYVDKKFNMNDIQLFNTGVPYLINSLNDYKKDLNQEILNFYGLSATNNKRERMLVDELNNNNDYKDRHVELMYKQRKLFCELVNDFYNLNITVEKLNNNENVSYESLDEGVDR